jgi:hypothetical protein
MLAGAALCAAVAPAAAGQRWRDPFARAGSPPAAAAGQEAPVVPEREPELRAIVYDKGQSLVNIDGRVLALGDSVRGFKLVQVEERGVTLARDGRRIKLTLDKDGSR